MQIVEQMAPSPLTRPRLEAIRVQLGAPSLVPSTVDRAWMDAFPERHAYRCLPLAIANAHCWDVLIPGDFEITWNGGAAAEDLTIEHRGKWRAKLPLDHFAKSNFSRGIITLHTGYIFRTPPGWNLLASGPPNEPRHGIYPLTGVIETDWLPYPFTMNWQMLKPGTVRFEEGEVFCSLMPIPKDYLGDWEVSIHELADDPVLGAEFESFRRERAEFMTRIDAKDPVAVKEAWQRHYFVGRHPDGSSVDAHVNKVRLAVPLDRSGIRPLYAQETTISELAAQILASSEKVTAGPKAGATITEAAALSARANTQAEHHGRDPSDRLLD